MNNNRTKKITTVAMLVAMGVALNLFLQFPLVPSVSFLNYDAKDILIVIGGCIYGPATSLLMSAICSVFDVMFRGGNLLDILMNMISTCTFACTAAYIYKKRHTRTGAMIGLLAGMVCMTVSMVFWNYIVTPFYYGMPREAVVAMLPAIALFNFLKSGINAGVTMFIYKPVVSALRSSHLVEESESTASVSRDWYIVGGFILVTFIGCVVAFNGLV